MTDEPTTKPGKQDMQRAAEAVKTAAGMVAYCCADRLGMKPGPRPHLNDVNTEDVIDALTHMLADQIQSVDDETDVRIDVELCDENAWKLAEQIAHNSGYDYAQFKGATRLGDKREKLWAASQAYKPEDSPGWGETD